jgi:hypothetical protein
MDFFSSKYNENYLDKVAYKGLLVSDINVDKINFTLVSIYGPNDDNPQFYENIMSI